MRLLLCLALILACQASASADDDSRDRPSLRASALGSTTLRAAASAELPRYELEVDLEPSAGRFTLVERVRLIVPPGKPAREIPFYVYANTAGARRTDGSAAVRLVAGACSGSVICRVESSPGGLLRVILDRPVRAGAPLEVSFEMEGLLPRFEGQRTSFDAQAIEALASLGSRRAVEDFGILAQGDGVSSMGGFYAVLAPHDKRGWRVADHSPLGDLTSDDLGNVYARVRVPRDTHVVTSGITRSSLEDDGRRELSVEAELVRDFAILASPAFRVREEQVGDVLVRVSLLPHSQQRADAVLRAATQSLALFDEVFGRYPYAELDVVEAPLVGGVGGVEFSGLVTIARMMLEPPNKSGLTGILSGLSDLLGAAKDLVPDRDVMLDLVVAHEVAHQWWHVLVGSDSRADPFVDEGLAQWSALYFLERQRSAESARHAEKQIVLSYQTMRMLGESDGAVNRAVDAFATPLAYSGLVYGKGPMLYRELRREVGDGVFLQALMEYTRRYAFRTAPRNGFVAVLASMAPGTRVRAHAKRWLDEEHGDRDLGTMSGGAGIGGLDALLPPKSRPGGAGGIDAKSLERMKGLLEQLLRSR